MGAAGNRIFRLGIGPLIAVREDAGGIVQEAVFSSRLGRSWLMGLRVDPLQ